MKTFTANTVAGINEKYNYKIFNGKCIEQCPTGTQEVDKNGSKTCQVSRNIYWLKYRSNNANVFQQDHK